MPIIIDGYNYIGAVKSISLADKDKEEKIINEIRYLLSSSKNKVTIVFDGQKNSVYKEGTRYKKGFISIVISRYPATADDVIKKMIDGSGHRKDLVIVSSDQDIYQYALKKGTKAMASLEFKNKYTKSRLFDENKLNYNVSTHEIEYWLKTFKEK